MIRQSPARKPAKPRQLLLERDQHQHLRKKWLQAGLKAACHWPHSLPGTLALAPLPLRQLHLGAWSLLLQPLPLLQHHRQLLLLQVLQAMVEHPQPWARLTELPLHQLLLLLPCHPLLVLLVPEPPAQQQLLQQA